MKYLTTKATYKDVGGENCYNPIILASDVLSISLHSYLCIKFDMHKTGDILWKYNSRSERDTAFKNLIEVFSKVKD